MAGYDRLEGRRVLLGDVRGLLRVPAAVALSRLDGALARVGHEAAPLELARKRFVLFRPHALRAARGEVLAVGRVVDALHAPVDPAEAERLLQRLGRLERRISSLVVVWHAFRFSIKEDARAGTGMRRIARCHPAS